MFDGCGRRISINVDSNIMHSYSIHHRNNFPTKKCILVYYKLYDYRYHFISWQRCVI